MPQLCTPAKTLRAGNEAAVSSVVSDELPVLAPKYVPFPALTVLRKKLVGACRWARSFRRKDFVFVGAKL